MRLRLATAEERTRWMELPGIWVDLHNALVFAAEDQGQVIGFLAAHAVWHVEHLWLDPRVRNRITRSRASVLLYRAMERWLAQTPIRWIYVFTRSQAVRGWAGRLGWTRAFWRARCYVKFLR